MFRALCEGYFCTLCPSPGQVTTVSRDWLGEEKLKLQVRQWDKDGFSWFLSRISCTLFLLDFTSSNCKDLVKAVFVFVSSWFLCELYFLRNLTLLLILSVYNFVVLVPFPSFLQIFFFLNFIDVLYLVLPPSQLLEAFDEYMWGGV